jgi:hypothetical protein
MAKNRRNAYFRIAMLNLNLVLSKNWIVKSLLHHLSKITALSARANWYRNLGTKLKLFFLFATPVPSKRK